MFLKSWLRELFCQERHFKLKVFIFSPKKFRAGGGQMSSLVLCIRPLGWYQIGTMCWSTRIFFPWKHVWYTTNNLWVTRLDITLASEGQTILFSVFLFVGSRFQRLIFVWNVYYDLNDIEWERRKERYTRLGRSKGTWPVFLFGFSIVEGYWSRRHIVGHVGFIHWWFSVCTITTALDKPWPGPPGFFIV